MTCTTPCPRPRELLKFVLGQVAEPIAQRLTQHVETCTLCQKSLEALGLQQTLIGEAPAELRQPPALIRTPAAPAPAEPGGGRTPAPSPRQETPIPASPPPGLYPTESLQELRRLLSPPATPDEMGRLGPFRVLDVLGSGGMGVVFLAEDIQLRRRVALKVMKPVATGQHEARQRFLREARAAAAIEHENVVTIYHVGEDRDVPYLAMQFLQGETLEARLKKEKTLSVLEVLRIGREIAEGLAAAHEQGVIHRDIKPANIWLQGNRSRVKLVDFGLARAVTEDVQLTKTGTIMGTPAYMSPEQARGAALDHRTDLYSLGCVLYHMAAGRPPFVAEDTLSLMVALANDTPPSIQAFNPAMPDILAALVQKLMAKHPDARPDATTEVVEVFEVIEERVAEQVASGEALTWDGRPRDLEPDGRGVGLVKAGLLMALGFGGYFLVTAVLQLLELLGP